MSPKCFHICLPGLRTCCHILSANKPSPTIYTILYSGALMALWNLFPSLWRPIQLTHLSMSASTRHMGTAETQLARLSWKYLPPGDSHTLHSQAKYSTCPQTAGVTGYMVLQRNSLTGRGSLQSSTIRDMSSRNTTNSSMSVKLHEVRAIWSTRSAISRKYSLSLGNDKADIFTWYLSREDTTKWITRSFHVFIAVELSE